MIAFINRILSMFKVDKNPRKIDKIIIHCAATPPDMDIGADTIREWHLQRGWSDIGYHDVIRRNGVVEGGRPDHLAGAHVKGHNKNSIGICLVGGVDKNGKPDNNFTPEQWKALERLVRMRKSEYPKAKIHGHNEFAAKACPSFDVQEWLKTVNLGA